MSRLCWPETIREDHSMWTEDQTDSVDLLAALRESESRRLFGPRLMQIRHPSRILLRELEREIKVDLETLQMGCI